MKIECAHTELMDVDLLTPNPRNPNKHPENQIKLLAKIMNHQGWRSPVVVSKRSGFIVKGHGRLMAAKLNGWSKAPVDLQDYLNDADEYADMVADNKIAELADTDMLMVNADAMALGPDFDLELLGIPDFEIVPTENLEPGCDEDAVPEKVPAKTKLGDLYLLGEHRLLCGDSSDEHYVKILMNNQKADVVFTDPPYNLQENGKSKRTNKSESKTEEFGKWDVGFDPLKALELIDLYTQKNSHRFICTSHYLFGKIQDFFLKLGDRTNYLVWVKNNPMPSLSKGTYVQATELIVHSRKGKTEFKYPVGKNLPNVVTGNVEKHTEGHPCQKPVYFIEYFLEPTSGIVLDLFGGSGSTLIASEKNGRTCYMMELDPHYCDVIVARWEKYTGKKAELING
jgi:DNA modification methylase